MDYSRNTSKRVTIIIIGIIPSKEIKILSRAPNFLYWAFNGSSIVCLYPTKVRRSVTSVILHQIPTRCSTLKNPRRLLDNATKAKIPWSPCTLRKLPPETRAMIYSLNGVLELQIDGRAPARTTSGTPTRQGIVRVGAITPSPP